MVGTNFGCCKEQGVILSEAKDLLFAQPPPTIGRATTLSTRGTKKTRHEVAASSFLLITLSAKFHCTWLFFTKRPH